MPLLCFRKDPQCSSFGIQLRSLAKVKNGSCVFKNILIPTAMSGAPTSFHQTPQVLCCARWAHRIFLHTYQNSLYMTVIFISISPLITNSSAYTGSALDPPQILLSTLCIKQDSTPEMAQSYLECDEIE